MKKTCTIVEAVTMAVNAGMDQYWAIDYSMINNWERGSFITHTSAAESAALRDTMRMETMTQNPGSKHLYA